MDKTKKIILVSIIILIVIIFIGVIFNGTKLTKKPAPVVEEKPAKIESLPKIEKIRKFKIDYDELESKFLSPIFLSPNGQYVGVFFVKDNKNYIQINDKAYAYNELYYLSFSEDGSKYGWTFLKDPCKDYGEIIGTQCDFYIQINNQTYGPYDGAYGPIFSDDGSKYGWQFVKDKEDYIQINNQIFGPYESIFDLQLSNDGSKYGWTFGKDCATYAEVATICDKYFIQINLQINDETYGPYDP
jgi:hypothetical protein